MPMAFANDVLNSLTAHIAVLDERGVILSANEAWNRFAAENGAPASYVGMNYVAVCERAAEQDETAKAALEGLRAVMRGESALFSLEYPCHSPTVERWFSLRVTPVSSGSLAAFVVAHDDITLRRRSEDALRETKGMLQHVLDTLPVGVWIMDRTGRITQANPAGLRIWAGARYVGIEQFGEYKGWWLSTGARIAAEEWAAARAIRDGETSLDEEIVIECFDGTRKIILNSAMPLFGEDGSIRGAIIVNQDITARKQIEQELESTLSRERMLARTDDLTGAFNRRHFFDLAQHELAIARRYRQPLAVILLDIDQFKKINDTAGHDAGDEVLRRVAHAARKHLRAADVFARYGGDEFIILLPRTKAVEGLVVAERIRGAIADDAATVTASGVRGVTISSGVAELLAAEDDSLDQLVQRADDALYLAKKQGRDRTMVADVTTRPRA